MDIIERLRTLYRVTSMDIAEDLSQEAADEIARLRGEVARLQDRLRCESKAREGREALLKDNERLEAERDAAVADAERYRYLRNRSKAYAVDLDFNPSDEPDHKWITVRQGDDLDAAIDVARKEGA